MLGAATHRGRANGTVHCGKRGQARSLMLVRFMSRSMKGQHVSQYVSKLGRRQELRNREAPTHKFPLGAFVLRRINLGSAKELFRITRLLPDDGQGFQYRIKGERDGIERVVMESSLEALQ